MRFPEKSPLPFGVVREVTGDDLDRRTPAQPRVLRQKDLSHPSLGELATDAVVTEEVLERVERSRLFGHERRLWPGRDVASFSGRIRGMRKLLISILISGAAVAAEAATVGGVNISDTSSAGGQNLVLNGAGL